MCEDNLIIYYLDEAEIVSVDCGNHPYKRKLCGVQRLKKMGSLVELNSKSHCKSLCPSC